MKLNKWFKKNKNNIISLFVCMISIFVVIAVAFIVVSPLKVNESIINASINQSIVDLSPMPLLGQILTILICLLLFISIGIYYRWNKK